MELTLYWTLTVIHLCLPSVQALHLLKNYKERDCLPISPGLSCDLPLRHARRFADPWTVTHQAPLPMGVFQATVLEWAAMPSSRGSSKPRDQTQVSHIAGGFFAS